MGRHKAVLGESDARAIDHAMSQLNVAMAHMDRIEACGYDCSEYRASALYLHDQLSKMKAHLFGGPPPIPTGELATTQGGKG